MNSFHYLTSPEAIEAQGYAAPGVLRHVSDLPPDLNWGMLPLGWHYFGHTTDNRFDLWVPEEQAIKYKNVRGFTHTHSLWVPRSRWPGQFEIEFKYLPPRNSTHAPDMQYPFYGTQMTLWSKNITTSAELDRELLELHNIAKDPAALDVFTALNLPRLKIIR